MLLLFTLVTPFIASAQKSEPDIVNNGITEMVLVSTEATDEQLESILELVKTKQGYDGFINMKISDDMMSPQGPPSYRAVIETHWKSMEDMIKWVEVETKGNDPAKGGNDNPFTIFFYNYRNEQSALPQILGT